MDRRAARAEEVPLSDAGALPMWPPPFGDPGGAAAAGTATDRGAVLLEETRSRVARVARLTAAALRASSKVIPGRSRSWWRDVNLSLASDGELLEIAQAADDAAIVSRLYGDEIGDRSALERRRAAEAEFVRRCQIRAAGT